MSLLTEILKEAPLSAVLQEKVKVLESENTKLHKELNDCRSLHKMLQDEHEKLVALHAEEVRIHSGVEFRRGKRTGGNWMAFCPVCHHAANEVEAAYSPWMLCSVSGCAWIGVELKHGLASIFATLQT